eukprot:CAMPEP_0172447696 /NCGR_PEP_ID=MMETSP1065-20121228/6950_1 /TAXON_ID=265537 /ORGANISM="Amphiprora paludosa, Strain CCMP125" /LENGTH=208 /DNA_ID=CAMNT_0013199059 /DNA_START=160 /DNA_END=786 /DNA_ORIENTATION=+
MMKKMNSPYESDLDDTEDDGFEHVACSSHSTDEREPTDLSPQHELKFDWGQLVTMIKSSRNFCEPPVLQDDHHGGVNGAPRARAVTADSESSILPHNNNNHARESEDLWTIALEHVKRGFGPHGKSLLEQQQQHEEPLQEWEEEEEDSSEEEEGVTTLVISEFESHNSSALVSTLEHLLTVVLLLGAVYQCLIQMGLKLEFVFEEDQP